MVAGRQYTGSVMVGMADTPRDAETAATEGIAPT